MWKSFFEDPEGNPEEAEEFYSSSAQKAVLQIFKEML